MPPSEMPSNPVTLSHERPSTPSEALGALGWPTLFDVPELLTPAAMGVPAMARSILTAAIRMAEPAAGLVLATERGAALRVAAALGLPPELEALGHETRRVVEDAIREGRPVTREILEALEQRCGVAVPLAMPLREPERPACLEPLATEAAAADRRRSRPPSSAGERAGQPGPQKTVGVLYVERAAARPFMPDEVAGLEALGSHAVRSLALASLVETAVLDPLTGFVTRARLESVLAAETTLASHLGRPLALLLLDLGGFEERALTRGRRWADQVLSYAAARIRERTREGSVHVRYGGGKFLILLPGAGEAEARAVFERIAGAATDALRGHWGEGVLDGPESLRLAGGIALYPHDGDRQSELVKRADQALFLAESEGGGKAVAFGPAFTRHALRTDKLTGIITGDADRDFRNVLLLLDAIAVVNSIHERAPLLSTILDMVIDLASAERGIILVPEDPPAPPRTTDDTQRLAAIIAERVGVELERAPRPAPLVVAIAQDEARRPVPPEHYARAIVDRVRETGLPVTLLDFVGDDPRMEEAARELGLALVVCLPLKVKERLAGIIYVDGRCAPRDLGEADLVFLQALAREVAVALDNARLFDEGERARREVEELNRKLARKVRKQASELEEAKAVLEIELKTKFDYDRIVGKSAKMQEVYKLLDRITDTDLPVLIQGESGTGKELVAKAIHYNGPRKRKRFVSVNCAAIAPTLLESELFGHVRGSFTGADRDRPGLFEQADQGTLFLDEVQDMPPQLQRELLRVLQEKEIRRVGGKDLIAIDVRVIAASNRELRDLIRGQAFREDLYYRLAVVTLDLPPLRERKEDIPLIVERSLAELSRAQGRPRVDADRAAMKKLLRHDWPGNVRELKNVLERALLLSDGGVLTEQSIDLATSGDARAPRSGPGADLALAASWFDMPYKDAAEAFKTEYVRRVLERNAGNVTRASEQSGLFRSSLHKIMRKLDVSARELRSPGERPPGA